MKKLFRFASKKPVSLTTEFARRRLARTMPGETAAMNAIRLGGMVF